VNRGKEMELRREDMWSVIWENEHEDYSPGRTWVLGMAGRYSTLCLHSMFRRDLGVWLPSFVFSLKVLGYLNLPTKDTTDK